MSATITKTSPDSITPAVHLEFIHNQLENPEGSAHEEIEGYHRALFLHHHAVEWEAYRQQARTHGDKLAFLEGRLKDTELRLSERPKLIPVTVDGHDDVHPTSPWNFWDRSMFIICALGILSLITFGVLNISFNLLESGFVTFRENPFRSYLWAALLPVGALAVKVGWDCLPDGRQRVMYLWSCLGLGMLGVLTWVGAYACVYPTLSKGINEQIASMTVFDNPANTPGTGARVNFAGAKWVDVVTVAGQAVAEVFLSAVLGMYLTSLYARHRPVRLAEDPAFRQLEEEHRSLQEEISKVRVRLGEASGHLVRLENQLTALVAYGKSMFHREAAKRQDQSEKRKVILDQLSDHLRNHLDAAEPANRLAAASAGSSLSRKNGD
jgi:hypothetical protein